VTVEELSESISRNDQSSEYRKSSLLHIPAKRGAKATLMPPERLGKREKILLSIFFKICEGKSHVAFFYKRAERHLEADYLPLFVKTVEEDVWRRREKWRFRKAIRDTLMPRGYVVTAKKFYGRPVRGRGTKYLFLELTEKGVEAGRRAARELTEEDVLLHAIINLRLQGMKWAQLDEIREEVWKESEERKLFENREEFERYWTKKKLGMCLQKMGVKRSRKRVGGEPRIVYIFSKIFYKGLLKNVNR